MKTFKEYLTEEQRMIVPATTRIAEPLPHGFSVKGSPIIQKKQTNNKSPKIKQLTFADRLRIARERAAR